MDYEVFQPSEEDISEFGDEAFRFAWTKMSSEDYDWTGTWEGDPCV